MLDKLEPCQLKEIKTKLNIYCSELDEKKPIRVIAAIVTKVVDSESAFECFQKVEKMLENNQEIKDFLKPLQLSQLQYLTEYHMQTKKKKKDQKYLKTFLFKYLIENNIKPEDLRKSLELATQPTGKAFIKTKLNISKIV